MNAINGITISLSRDDQPMVIGEYPDSGLLGKLKPGKIKLTIESENLQAWIFTVSGNKDVQLSKNHAPAHATATYHLAIAIVSNEHDVVHTVYPTNNIRVLLQEEGGRFSIYEIALVVQRGYGWLSVQKTYAARCFAHQGRLLCPAFTKWPSLMTLLNQLYQDEIPTLPGLNQYELPEPISHWGLCPGEGRIIWWNNAMGCGAIMTDHGMARICLNEIKSDLHFITFNPDQLVRFKNLRQPTSASTSFRLEAVEVKLAA